MLLLIGVLLALGAVAAAVVRTGPGFARAAAVIAMVAVAIAALVPPRSVPEQLPAQVAVACSNDAKADGVAAAVAALAAAGGKPAQLVSDARLPAALAHAALLAGPRRDELLAVWNGPLAAQAPLSAPVAGTAYTTAPPLPFVPESVRLRAVSTPVAGRPLQLLASVAGLATPLAAKVTIAGDAAAAREFEVVLPVVGAASLDAGVASAGSLTAEVSIAHARHRLRARGDLAVAAPLPLLVIERGGTVAAALAAQGVVVTTASALPPDLDGLAAIALGLPLAATEQDRLVRAIGDGLGVFAFGPGLQREGEPLRAVWPVRLRPAAAPNGGATRPEPRSEPAPPRPPETIPPTEPPAEPPRVDPGGPVEVDRHAIAMVFVVDRSYSMGQRVAGGATKMSFVKTSADRTAAALEAGDQVGVVTFGDPDQGRVVLPLTAVTDRAAVARGIGQLAHAAEGTFLLGGLRVAQQLLAASTAAVRHVVVLTDGEYMPSEQFALRAVAREMAAAGITVSILAIVDGGTDSEFHGNCELLARDGGGVFFPVADATRVPQFVSAEVVRTMGRLGRRAADPPAGTEPVADAPTPPPATEPDPAPVPPGDTPAESAPRALVVRAVADSPLLQPLPAQWPELGAAHAATAGFDAHVLLVAGDEGLPLLAFANRGLGRVGVFAAELAGDEAQAFRREPAFPARLSQWVHAVTRAVPSLPVDLLRERAVTPPAPTPAEVAQLHAATGKEPLPIAALQLPPPRTAFAWRSQVPRYAAVAAGVLCLLVLLEWACVRRAG